MKRKTRISSWLADSWQTIILVAIGAILVGGLLTYRLGRLTPALAQAEVAQLQAADSFNKIIDNPLYLPHKIGHFIAQKIDGINIVALARLPSAAIGFVAVFSMFLLLRSWHTNRVALLGTAIFATSSWFLSVARLATTDSVYLLVIVLILCGVWLQKERHVLLASILTVLIGLLLLYIPAMVWLVIPALIWQRRILKTTLRQLSAASQAGIFFFTILGIVPLVWALIQSPELASTWLGMPEKWPTISGFGRAVLDVPLGVIYARKADPVYSLADLPLLDALTCTLVALGVFAYSFRIKLDRTKLLIGLAAAGTLLVAASSPVPMSFLLPILYIFAASGIALLLQQWFTVFPRNPFARSVAVILVSACLGLSIFYHMNRYFIAWPNTPQTKTTFRHRP